MWLIISGRLKLIPCSKGAQNIRGNSSKIKATTARKSPCFSSTTTLEVIFYSFTKPTSRRNQVSLLSWSSKAMLLYDDHLISIVSLQDSCQQLLNALSHRWFIHHTIPNVILPQNLVKYKRLFTNSLSINDAMWCSVAEFRHYSLCLVICSVSSFYTRHTLLNNREHYFMKTENNPKHFQKDVFENVQKLCSSWQILHPHPQPKS